MRVPQMRLGIVRKVTEAGIVWERGGEVREMARGGVSGSGGARKGSREQWLMKRADEAGSGI